MLRLKINLNNKTYGKRNKKNKEKRKEGKKG